MKTILRRAAVAAAVVITAGAIGAPAAFAGGDHGGGQTILRAEIAGSLRSDPVLFPGTTTPVAPGGADWVIGRGEARLRHDGRLDVRVDGLVLTSTGANPVAQVTASVACNGMVVATSGAVDFSTTGDATIRTTVSLPARCIAPVVLLNPQGRPGVYIGVTGTEG